MRKKLEDKPPAEPRDRAAARYARIQEHMAAGSPGPFKGKPDPGGSSRLKVQPGTHRMPNGKLMKDSAMPRKRSK